MKKTIVTLNLAGYNWTRTSDRWKTRLTNLCGLIKETSNDAFIIALQEFIGGSKYIDILQEQFAGYHLVTPVGYDPDANKRSAVNLILINKNDCEHYSTRTLNLSGENFLYNYVQIETPAGRFFRVLNAHLPQEDNEGRPDWYQQKRNLLRSQMEKEIIATSAFFRTEQDIQFIILGDMNATPASSFIRKLTALSDSPLWNATRTEDLDSGTFINITFGRHLDYIFFGRQSLFTEVIDPNYNEIIGAPITRKLSDHAMLLGSFNCA